ncbi:hypothetical protein NRB_17520 [Novosphingobium sp. 11B]
MQRLDPPGHLDDFDEQQKDAWSAQISAWLDRAQAGSPAENDGPRTQFFNPLHQPPGAGAQVAVISWNAFPRRVKSRSLSDRQRWRTADGDRNLQDEYCEWSVARDGAGRVVKVMFTCEGPEYWETLAELAPDKVLALYREHVSSAVTQADLFVGGRYNPKNRFNNSTSAGAMHLIQAANTLTAEIELAAAATIRRIKDGRELTGAQELIDCSLYGNAGRNSDPFIGEQVNALARQRADITLNNPVGLYLHGFNPVGWATPDGTDPRDFWKVTRGQGGYAVRAVFEVPAAKGYTVGDITIAGKPLEFGAQIADFITIKLEGLATRIGQSQTQPFDGCRQVAGLGAAPPDALGADLSGRQDAGALDEPDEADSMVLAEALPAVLRSREIELVDEAPPALIPYPRLPTAKLAQRQVTGRILAYASPDSTFAVTRKLIDAATTSIVVGIYDFNASYVKDALKRAMRRGVQLSLMLDTNAADDEGLFGELRGLGATCVQAPSSSAGHPAPYFGNAHEKVIVIDGEIVMIQSGNWSENSIPFNEQDGVAGAQFASGNRDMGLAMESRALATFFADLVLRDMRLSQGLPPDAAPPEAPAASSLAADMFFETAPEAIPQRLFPSLSFVPEAAVPVTPVITPENFEPELKKLLSSATRSLRIEQQYIRGQQATVRTMLEAIAEARAAHADLDIKIIVSPKYLYGEDKTKFLDAMRDFDLAFDEHFRFLSLKHFVHCHNKLIVVDDAATLLGSQNWSTTGIVSNREASLLVESSKISRYFASIFDADWDMSAATAPPSDLLAALADASMFAQGHAVTSSLRDYADV